MRVICSAPLLLLVGCLQPGDAVYGKVDTTPPTIVQIEPDILSPVPDGGSYQTLTPGQTITIHFSETMDPSSLRPGIAIYKDMAEIPLNIEAMPAASFITNPVVIPNIDNDYAVRIQPTSPSGFEQGAHLLRLRTLLVDVAGNPLAEQFENFFFVM